LREPREELRAAHENLVFSATGNTLLSYRDIMLAVDDEDGPAAFGEQRAESLRQVRIAPDTQDEHLPGHLAQLAG
jgi:hypothetical protein